MTAFRSGSLVQWLADTSFLNGGSAPYVEGLAEQYEHDPSSLPTEWQAAFAGAVRMAAPSPGAGLAKDGNLPSDATGSVRDAIGASRLIHAYRSYGHLQARLDPLGLKAPDAHADLDYQAHGFTDADLDRVIAVDGTFGQQTTTLRNRQADLRARYGGTIGYDYMHIADTEQREWLRERIEGPVAPGQLSPTEKMRVLEKLVEVKGYERYLDKKFVGTKRFGLDGAEATIPALEAIIELAAHHGVTDAVIGMAHRGRLNVLSQVIGKPHRAIFHEFRGGAFFPEEVEGSGDVKYHLGVSGDREFGGRTIHLSLASNPSHLEIIDPVVLGKVRSKQDQKGDRISRTSVLPLLIHGDAAFAGQGVVAECFALSGLEGYRTGGSLHFIINNQIGFTTDPTYARSSPHPSDLAKVVGAPIFHVNGDDPEAVVTVARLALEFRQRFGKPVVIDMVCFRYYGHNESDEPAFTQPLMYKAIRSHPSTLEVYADRLRGEGILTDEVFNGMKAAWVAYLDRELEASQAFVPASADWLGGRWEGLRFQGDAAVSDASPPTGVGADVVAAVGAALTRVPERFRVHPTIQRFLDQREKSIAQDTGIDWSTAEALALGTLLHEGTSVRLTGQDTERGTFTQRHAVLSDQATGARHVPIGTVARDGASFEVLNSLLSEEAVLGLRWRTPSEQRIYVVALARHR
ncbi:2-oxoglutarate dehydrogenase E1 component [Luteibacter sp. NPDC031894]|uniref:2-oxoglutarate dehydrogenase E1 component n=1 Tax=Luteibacter sp. NPDC031894 TaxID=3390572 RepID=UPI003D06DAFA